MVKMSESPPHDSTEEVTEENPSQDEEVLTELRSLLLGTAQVRLNELQERLDDPKLHANDVSRVLPEAIVLRSSRDKHLAEALEPTIEETIKTSIKKDRKVFVDVLYPVMGPAIRKSISSVILGMVQSFNQILEHSFSIQALKWRLEALRTKKSFGEVVLLHTLVYQVEQIFLIHRNTGLMLQHLVAKEVASQDPDLVSGMLTAIQDFMRDSFGLEEGESLDTLQIGNRSVWIEQGPHAMLTAVIRGNPPEDLKSILNETIESIHLTQGEELESFEGDATPFEATRDQLENCLQTQFKQKKQKTSPLLWIILGAVVFLIGLWSFFFFRDHQRWADYLERLHKAPGIVVATAEKRSGKRYISGLRDPLAPEPVGMLKEAKLEPDKVIFRWEPYYSIHPEFMLKRSKDILAPPETVTLELRNGILRGIGSAPHQWIAETRKLVKAIPGLVQYRDDGVIDIDRRDMEIIREKIDKQFLLFQTRESEIASGQENRLQELVGDIEKLQRLAEVLGKNALIEIAGHTDSAGSEEENLSLSRERADNVLSILVSKGLKEDNFTATGVGSKKPLRKEIMEQDRKFNRRVTFRLILTDKPN